MRVRLGDPMRAKHLGRRSSDLAEEGVTQVFRPQLGAEWIVGVVGPAPARRAADPARRRVQPAGRLRGRRPTSPPAGATPTTARELERFREAKRASLANDRDGNPVFLARNNWDLGRVQEDFPKIRFTATRERH